MHQCQLQGNHHFEDTLRGVEAYVNCVWATEAVQQLPSTSSLLQTLDFCF